MPLNALTFGCRLNAAETRVMRARAAEAGLADAVLVNTCAVTAEAVRQARQAIRKARREHPGKKIVVSGCAAQIEPGTFAAMPEVDLVLGNAEKLSADAYRPPIDAAHGLAIAPHEKVRVSDIFAVAETAPHLVEGFPVATHGDAPGAGDAGDHRARAFLEVQNGCDHRCTFCIIPYGRGNARSVPMGAVVQSVRRLAEAGVAEIVLTGVDLTSYGGDLPGRPRLGGGWCAPSFATCRSFRACASLPSTPWRPIRSLSPPSPRRSGSCRISICRCNRATT